MEFLWADRVIRIQNLNVSTTSLTQADISRRGEPGVFLSHVFESLVGRRPRMGDFGGVIVAAIVDDDAFPGLK